MAFKQADFELPILQFIAAMDQKLASPYFHHVQTVEETYQKVDTIVEEKIKPDLQGSVVETDSDDGQGAKWSEFVYCVMPDLLSIVNQLFPAGY